MVDYQIIPKWKDGSILKPKIINKETKMKINIIDSLQFLDESLNSILNTFDCKIKKGMFSHNFVTKERLNYIGEIQDFEYYFNNSYAIEANKEQYLVNYNNLF